MVWILVSLLVVSIVVNIKLFLDLQKRKRLCKSLEEIATTDHLTKINNKYKIKLVLKEQMAIAKRYNRYLSIIRFSIDNFNDLRLKYGEDACNEVIQDIVELVTNDIRFSDVLGRWDDNGFIVVLPETSLIHAVMLAEKLRQKVEIYQFTKIEKLTASFGVSVMNDNDELETFAARAQTALNKARDVGDNKIEVI